MSAVSTVTTSVPALATPHPNCRKIGTVRDPPAGICTPSTGIGDEEGIGIEDEPGIGIDPCVGMGIGVNTELGVDPVDVVNVEKASGTAWRPSRSVKSNRSCLAMRSEPAPIVMMIRTPKVEPPGQRRSRTSSGVAIDGSAVTKAAEDPNTVGAVGWPSSRSPQPGMTPIAGKRRIGTYFEKTVRI
jgi:hypothetical protein